MVIEFGNREELAQALVKLGMGGLEAEIKCMEFSPYVSGFVTRRGNELSIHASEVKLGRPGSDMADFLDLERFFGPPSGRLKDRIFSDKKTSYLGGEEPDHDLMGSLNGVFADSGFGALRIGMGPGSMGFPDDSIISKRFRHSSEGLMNPENPFRGRNYLDDLIGGPLPDFDSIMAEILGDHNSPSRMHSIGMIKNLRGFPSPKDMAKMLSMAIGSQTKLNLSTKGIGSACTLCLQDLQPEFQDSVDLFPNMPVSDVPGPVMDLFRALMTITGEKDQTLEEMARQRNKIVKKLKPCLKSRLPEFIIWFGDIEDGKIEPALLGNSHNSENLDSKTLLFILKALRKKYPGKDTKVVCFSTRVGKNLGIWAKLKQDAKYRRENLQVDDPVGTNILDTETMETFLPKILVLAMGRAIPVGGKFGPTPNFNYNDLLAENLLTKAKKSQVMTSNGVSIIQLGAHHEIMDMPEFLQRELCPDCPCGCDGVLRNMIPKYEKMHPVDFAVNVLGAEIPEPIQVLLKEDNPDCINCTGKDIKGACDYCPE